MNIAIAQLQIFGFSMYGRYGVAAISVTPLGSDYLTGGIYGPEASIIITFLLISASIFVLLTSRNKKLIKHEKNYKLK